MWINSTVSSVTKERSNISRYPEGTVLKSNSSHALRFMAPSTSQSNLPSTSHAAESSTSCKHNKQWSRLKNQKNYNGCNSAFVTYYVVLKRGILPSSLFFLLLILLLLVVVLHQSRWTWHNLPNLQYLKQSNGRADSISMLQLILPRCCPMYAQQTEMDIKPSKHSLDPPISDHLHDISDVVDDDELPGMQSNDEVVQHRDKSSPNHLDFNTHIVPRSDGEGYIIRRSSDQSKTSKHPLGLSNPMKIFVYDLPSRFNEDWLRSNNVHGDKNSAEHGQDSHRRRGGDSDDDRCANHLFAAEVAIHKRLLSNTCTPIRTMRPWDADLFFVPVYLSCNFNTSTGFPSLGHARSLLQSAVRLVSHQMPYWNHSKGKDHIFVATHDYGACFHTMEDIAIATGIPRFLQNSIILQTFGQTNNHPCQPRDRQNYIQIPPFVPPSSIDPAMHPEKQTRDIWAYFRGKIELHPKNISGRVYSRGVRSVIWRRFRHNHRFFIERAQSPEYRAEMGRSVFCLCPLGWAPWSPRIVESVLFGCVPVIIADHIALPYSHVIDWPEISIRVPERDVRGLGKILDAVARTNLSAIQAHLWSPKFRSALSYMDPLAEGDATWQALDLLSRRLTRAGETG